MIASILLVAITGNRKLKILWVILIVGGVNASIGLALEEEFELIFGSKDRAASDPASPPPPDAPACALDAPVASPEPEPEPEPEALHVCTPWTVGVQCVEWKLLVSYRRYDLHGAGPRRVDVTADGTS